MFRITSSYCHWTLDNRAFSCKHVKPDVSYCVSVSALTGPTTGLVKRLTWRCVARCLALSHKSPLLSGLTSFAHRHLHQYTSFYTSASLLELGSSLMPTACSPRPRIANTFFHRVLHLRLDLSYPQPNIIKPNIRYREPSFLHSPNIFSNLISTLRAPSKPGHYA